MKDLSVVLGPMRLKNPLVAVSGTFGYGYDYEDILPPEAFGAITLKGTSPEPWAGNKPPRLVETPSGMLNSIGLQNPGVQQLCETHLPRLQKTDVCVIVNVVGRTVADYQTVAEKITDAGGADALELNISCPNVKAGGMSFGVDPQQAAELTAAVGEVTHLPLVVKLTPNVTDIAEIACAVEDAGADVISLINTLQGMEIDVEREEPTLGAVFGGLSGPAIRPVALRCIWQVYEAVDIPVLGMGGVSSARDVLAFMMAGADAIGIGTSLFSRPTGIFKILDNLRDSCYDDWPVGRAH